MFVLNKFYYYICKGKEGKTLRHGQRAIRPNKKTDMTSSLYIIISLILVVLHR